MARSSGSLAKVSDCPCSSRRRASSCDAIWLLACASARFTVASAVRAACLDVKKSVTPSTAATTAAVLPKMRVVSEKPRESTVSTDNRR